jgi:hypothetical protein
MRLSFKDVEKRTGIHEMDAESNPFKVGDKFHLYINEVVNGEHHQNSRKWYEVLDINIFMAKHMNMDTTKIDGETIITNTQTEKTITAYIDVVEVEN